MQLQRFDYRDCQREIAHDWYQSVTAKQTASAANPSRPVDPATAFSVAQRPAASRHLARRSPSYEAYVDQAFTQSPRVSELTPKRNEKNTSF
jgi:hypothetical protein